MNCEEFELIGLDLEQSGCAGEERFAAREHLRVCARCAALAASWEEARAELLLLADQTRESQTPARVEMRLRQEFRSRRRPAFLRRRTLAVAAWAMAAAVLIIAGMSWKNWHDSQRRVAGHPSAPAVVNPASPADGDLTADNDAGSFTLLPGSFPQEAENAAVMRVRMQRGALGAFGLPVEQDRVSDWIQVDVLVGEDGAPEAIRLHQENLQAGSAQQKDSQE